MRVRPRTDPVWIFNGGILLQERTWHGTSLLMGQSRKPGANARRAKAFECGYFSGDQDLHSKTVTGTLGDEPAL